MLTKLLTTKGSEVVSAINPLAMIKGKTNFSLKCNALMFSGHFTHILKEKTRAF